MSKIAVLGGTGYLGYYVSKFFDAEPLSRRTGFDITDQEQCYQLQNYDVVIHMAALIDKSEGQPNEVFRVNAQGTLSVVRTLKKGHILIFTSTKEVYDLGDAYALSKVTAEKYINYYAKHNGFRAGIFRLSTTYAPPTNGSNFVNFFLKSIQEGTEISLLMEGKQRRDFLYVDDLSRAFERFIDLEASGVYDIGGGGDKSTTILGLIKIIENVVGKKANLSFSNEPVRGQIHYVTDLSRISKELDWQPKVSIAEGIKKIV